MDQFYTRDEIATYCINILKKHIPFQSIDLFIEPSAGRGSFFKLLPSDKRIGIDLDPKYDGIEQMDFLEYSHPSSHPSEDGNQIVVVGNPPFGRVSSLAIKFFNHAAQMPNVAFIAFIIPRTFKRVSVQNRLDLSFHLIYTEDLPLKPCCFEPDMDAKCCFQIWKRKTSKREPIQLPSTQPDFEFLPLGPKDANGQPTPPTGADFALLAYGGQCGRIVTDPVALKSLRPKSWHWIKSREPQVTGVLIGRFNQLDYSISEDTVRQNSIGQKELIYIYNQHLNINI
jgi:hypothetical protein